MSEAIKQPTKTKGQNVSKKHFEAVAAAIKLSVDQINNSFGFHSDQLVGIRATAINLANTFIDVNPRFDRARFLVACGIN